MNLILMYLVNFMNLILVSLMNFVNLMNFVELVNIMNLVNLLNLMNLVELPIESITFLYIISSIFAESYWIQLSVSVSS